MLHKKGFTLIELLVVIAIIALLLSILMPSLQVAKRIAQGVVCSNNNKNLAFAANLFAEDNDGYVPCSGANNVKNLKNDPLRDGWVLRPYDKSNNFSTELDARIRGI